MTPTPPMPDPPPVETLAQAPPENGRTPGVQPSFLLEYPADHGGNAKCVELAAGGTILYSKAFGWLLHTGRYFERGTDIKVKGFVKEVLRERKDAAESVKPVMDGIAKGSKLNRSNLDGTMDVLKPDVLVDQSDFDTSPHFINCANGVIDLRTGELAPHSSAQRFTYAIPTEYHPGADFDAWHDFVTDLVNLHEISSYLQEAVGYSLTGSTQEEIMFYLYGPTRAGKGTFIETVLATLGGMPIAAEIDFRMLTQTRSSDGQNFALAPLRPCRFVAASESRAGERLNAAKIKVLTGGNEIWCAHKGKDFFGYRPQFKIWLSSNFPVNADPDDDALWSRVRVVHFPNSWRGKEDKHLKRRMLSKCNLEAVLAWGVQGAMKWYERGQDGLDVPEIIRETTQAQREQQDFVGQWLEDCTVMLETGFVPNQELYASYKGWCFDNGAKPKGKRTLSVALKAKGYQTGAQQRVNGKNSKGCKGIGLSL